MISRTDALRLAQKVLDYQVVSHAEAAQILARFVLKDAEERERLALELSKADARIAELLEAAKAP
jgi:hypothetical protein